MKDSSVICIDVAEQNDMSAVLELIKELAAYENALHEVEMTIETLMKDGFGPKKLFDCLVAKDNKGIVLGFALYFTTYSTWKGKCLYLEDILVREEHRRKGIGSLLFDHLMEIAKDTGVKRFQWQVLDWNKPAINFYKKYAAILDEEWINCKVTF